MSAKELIVLLGGEDVGRVKQNAQGRLQFTYADAWRARKGAYPLSLSMPFLDAEHGHNRIEPFLARALGLPTANSQVLHFGDEPAIVVERYDRTRTAAGWIRIHQEDLCQALGIPPSKKYQDDGGPGARVIVDLLNSSSSARDEDRTVFVDALALNWLIAGTDAHAKNYSLLIAPEGRVRLAPLYDVASVLPYPQFEVRRVKLAMKVGGKYKVWDVGLREWRKLAAELKMDEDALIGRIADMASRIPDLVADIGGDMKTSGLEHAVIDRLSIKLIGRARLCLKQLRGFSSGEAGQGRRHVAAQQ